MNYYGAPGQTDEWYTPAYVFDALGVTFDLDVASPPRPTHVPCVRRISISSLETQWAGFIWMNPPFGGRNGLIPWLDKFFEHGDGIALTPDRTSAPWWHDAIRRADGVLFTNHKIKFERPDGSLGKIPGDGVCLFAKGARGFNALCQAARNGRGYCMVNL